VPNTSTSVIKSTLQTQCLDPQYATYMHVACVRLVHLSCRVSEGNLYLSEINSSLCMSERGNTGHKYLWTTHNMPLFLSFRSGYTSPVCVKVHVGCSTI